MQSTNRLLILKYDLHTHNIVDDVKGKYPSLIDGVISIINDAVETDNIDFKYFIKGTLAITVFPTDGKIFKDLLYYQLICKPKYEIKNTLSYHIGNCKDLKDFIWNLEYNVIPKIEKANIKFKEELLTIIHEWLFTIRERENLKHFSLHIKEEATPTQNDERINTGADNSTVIEYFQKLLRNNRQGIQIVSELKLRTIFYKYFYGFEKPKIIDESKIQKNISKSAIGKLFYDFFIKYDDNPYPLKLDEYCKILKNEFECFNNDSIDKIKSKLPSHKPKYYPFL